MSLAFGDVNWLAVLVGGILHMVLGFLWYGPLFGKLWMGLMGFSEEDIAGGPGIGYLFTFIAALIASLVLALIVLALGAASFVDGLLTGVLVALGFVATSSLTNIVFSNQHKGVWLLFAAYQTITLALVGGILAIW